jgi:pectate lyase-like protein
MSTQLSKRALFTRGALSAGVGLGALASFTALAFRANGAATPRTTLDRLAGLINVKDFGAIGDGVRNDAPAIQAAFDAAFGPASSPHGTDARNRPVYFPAGWYKVNSQLVLTQVLGGHIYGDAPRSTKLIAGRSSIGSIITTNGFENCRVENLGFESNYATVGCFNLDLASAGADVKLRNNLFLCCSFTTSSNPGLFGVQIAPSGNDGSANTFIRTEIVGMETGVKVVGANATNNVFLDSDFTGGSGVSQKHIWVAGGSVSTLLGCQWSMGTLGLKIETGDTFIAGSRMEGEPTFIDISGGSVAVYDFALGVGAPCVFVNMASPARVLLSGINDFNPPSQARLNGTGILEIQGSFLNVAFLSGFTGTLTRWQLPTGTYSSLPTGANAKAGMESNITDGDATLTFGHIETGGSNKSKYVRYNGTNWTVMGV